MLKWASCQNFWLPTFDLVMDWRTNWIKKYEENVVFIENVEMCDDQLRFFWCLRCSRSQILTTTQSSFSNKFEILFRFFYSSHSKRRRILYLAKEFLGVQS
jgi:hypothetical protein